MRAIKASIRDYDRLCAPATHGRFVIEVVDDSVPAPFSPEEMALIFEANRGLIDAFLPDYIDHLGPEGPGSLDELYVRRGVFMPLSDSVRRELHDLSSYSLALGPVEQFAQTWTPATRSTGMLSRNRSAADIAELEERARTYSGPYHHHVVDEHVDAMWRSSYSDAAVSLSAIGMIVPMAESVFSQSFQSLGSMYLAKRLEPPDHRRWQRAGRRAEHWNCQWYFGRDEPRNDIISGLPQLSEASGLSAYLEPDMMDWLAAMLSYRNRMFHGGFEWSVAQRNQFKALISVRNWDAHQRQALNLLPPRRSDRRHAAADGGDPRQLRWLRQGPALRVKSLRCGAGGSG
jgi:hypothetical protein